ncbi:MAG: hypothetical protein N2167_07170 [Flavobacteriales bacterium]|nr:hypothetical protein [Flavobacteriales bacterium]
MNVKPVILILGLLWSTMLCGQDVLVMDASIGVSLPVGQVSKVDISAPESGFAGVGGSIRFWVGLKPTKNFGFLFQMVGGLQSVKTKDLQQYVQSTYGISSAPVTTFYRYGTIQGGILISGIVEERWALDARLAVGYLWANSSMIDFTEYGTTYFKIYQGHGKGFSFGAGFGARYKIYKAFYTSMAFDFTGAIPAFENVVTETRNGSQTDFSMNNYTQFMGILQLTGGLGLAF